MGSVYNQSPVLPAFCSMDTQPSALPAPQPKAWRVGRPVRACSARTAAGHKAKAAPAVISPTLSALHRPIAPAPIRALADTLGRLLSQASLAAHVSAGRDACADARGIAHGMLHDILTPLAGFAAHKPGFAALQRQRQLLAVLNRHGRPPTPAFVRAPAPAKAAPLGPLRAPYPLAQGVLRALHVEDGAGVQLASTQRVAALITGEGRRYLISPTLAKGHAKRFCLGLTPEGAAVGVWQFAPHICMPHIQVEIANVARLCPDIEILDLIGTARGVFVVVTLLDGGHVTGAMADANELMGPVIAHHVMAQSAAQLAALHAHGFVHGDVKPDNMLFGSQGQMVLADLDLARALDAQRETPTHHAGTYLAPEVWMQTRVGPAIDIWAWAASLGDVYLGAACNPHRYMSQGTHRIDACASRRESWSFLHWRQRLLDASGSVDPNRVKHDASVWSRYYARLYDVAPVVCLFALRYGLEGDPDRRIDAPSARAFCQLLCQADEREQLNGAAQLRQLAPRPAMVLWTQNLMDMHTAIVGSLHPNTRSPHLPHRVSMPRAQISAQKS